MKQHYLSFGGGVNSVALYLLMLDLGYDFEAVYVDHGGDWPETHEYVEKFSKSYPITIIKPEHSGFTRLYDYCVTKTTIPSRVHRWCTSRFKERPFSRYVQAPCFVHIGIDAGEARRAKISSEGGREKRYLLIEHDIDRDGCKKLIAEHGIEIPMKSGCYFCPFQRIAQWKDLRLLHPDLFCNAQLLERLNNEYRREIGKPEMYYRDKPLEHVVVENQMAIPGIGREYPPCQCGL